MIKWFMKKLLCYGFKIHKPPYKLHRRYDDIAKCQRCGHLIKMLSNGEWELWK